MQLKHFSGDSPPSMDKAGGGAFEGIDGGASGPSTRPGRSFTQSQIKRLRQLRAQAYRQASPARRRVWRWLPSPAAIAVLLVAAALLLSAVLLRQFQVAGEAIESSSSTGRAAGSEASEPAQSETFGAEIRDEHLTERGGSGALSSSGADGSDRVANVGGQQDGQIVVHVSGAVTTPGVITLSGNVRVNDAVKACGGLLPEADLARINLAATVQDGTHIHVVAVGEANPPTSTGGSGGSTQAQGSLNSAGGTVSGGCVDVRTADEVALQTLRGVGPALAARIVQHRREHPFTGPEDLRSVSGIGAKTYAGMADQLCP